MSDILFAVLTFIFLIVAQFFIYMYITYRKDEDEKKRFFKLKYDRKLILISVATLMVSIAVYLYGCYVIGNVLMQSAMNAAVMMWISALAYIDFKEKIIPNKLIIAGIAFWVLLSLIEIFVAHTSFRSIMLYSLLGAGVCGGGLFIVSLIVKKALGMGDVKMFFVIGLLYGLENTYTILLVSMLIMAIVSVILLITKKATKKSAVPMAPFVAVGLLMNIILGV